MREFQTPMMQQFMTVKAQYPDCLLFFRLGDFYELFLEDAELGSRVLGITLTARPRGKDGHVPMAGVPFHAADTYLTKLVAAGYKVAICEQVSEPDSKGIVKREVVRVVTPGTILTDTSLVSQRNNFLCAVQYGTKKVGCAFVDISTGSFFATQLSFSTWKKELDSLLVAYEPREVILSPLSYSEYDIISFFSEYSTLNVTVFHDWIEALAQAKKCILDHFDVRTLAGFGIDGSPEVCHAVAAILEYVRATQKSVGSHLRSLRMISAKRGVVLDRSTIRNLELFTTIQEGAAKGSLLDVIDDTKSAGGARLLRRWLAEPLATKKEIVQRLDAVEELVLNQHLRDDIRSHLASVYDCERIISRFSVGLGVPPELVRLRKSLAAIRTLRTLLASCKAAHLQQLAASCSLDLQELGEYLMQTLAEEPRVDVKKGGVIAEGFDAELDELRALQQNDTTWLSNYEQSERKRTGIPNLKIKNNSVFGYYIEVSKSHLDLIPAEYTRKQTLVNAERFSTALLLEHEEKILTAQEKIEAIETKLFAEVVEKVLSYTVAIQEAAAAVATTDCLASFATTAVSQRYCKPVVGAGSAIEITAGRHPVVQALQEMGTFVPNDTLLNTSDRQLLLITGPNMAGKSVYMRQVALLVLLAHMGSFVPADAATISLVDRIFVRSGASDFITSGMSTFMVEMVEAATILNHATEKSLIIMDEIGRGTSTYDGISIAWAIAEQLVTGASRPKTLFATHYHELQQLATALPASIKNVHMAIDASTHPPTFLHTLVAGGASHSFGIAVARMAGVPEEVTGKAEQLLQHLEQANSVVVVPKTEKSETEEGPYSAASLAGKGTTSQNIIEKIRSISLDTCTPLEALSLLADLQESIRK